MVSLGILVGLTVVLFIALAQTTRLWFQLSSEQSVQLELRKAVASLERDTSMLSSGQTATARVSSLHHSGSADGDAFWFLSPRPGGEGDPLVKSDGRPFWQCHVLYYTVVPYQLEELSTGAVGAGADADGYEDRCPHKVLIRKVIDVGTPTDPLDESSEETLLTDVTPYLTRPTAHRLGAMASEPGVQKVEIVAVDLLTFRVQSGAAYGGETVFDLRAVPIEDVSKQSGYGQANLSPNPQTLHTLFSVPAQN